MGFQDFGDFVGGLNSSFAQQREANREDAAKQDQREQAVFTALANSDDPDIRAAAVTGLLTGKSPGKFFDRFLSKQQAHPAYEQIKGLIANGHQATLGQTEQRLRETEAQTQGQYTGRIKGVQAGAAAAGFSPDETKTLVRANLGGAQSAKAMALQKVVIHRKDGSTVGGWFNPDPTKPGFFDDNGEAVDDVASYETAARTTGATNVGGKGSAWKHMTMAQYRQMFPESAAGYESVNPGQTIQAYVSGDGKSASAPVLESPPPQNPNFSFIPTQNGVVAGNTHSGAISQPPGGAGLHAPTPPQTAAASVKSVYDSITRMHPYPKGLLGTGASPAEVQKWTQTVDAEAQRFGYKSFRDLQAAVGDAVGAVQDNVPPAGPPGTPGAAGASGPPPAPPTGGPNPRGRRSNSQPGGLTPTGPANDPFNLLPH